MEKMEKDDENKSRNSNSGCISAAIIFILIAAGIPKVVSNHPEEGPIGKFVLIVFGLALAFFVAKSFLDD